MHVIAVNRGLRARQPGSKSFTGIDKRPVDGSVHIGRSGVEGDHVCDGRYHGGADQAVYVYGGEDYRWWREVPGRDFAPGSFGENLVVEGLASSSLAIGDRLTIGSVVLEITDVRIPCGTLERKIGEPGFARVFAAADRPGVYARVLVEGTVSAGDTVEWSPYAGERISVLEVKRDYAHPDTTDEGIERLLSVPVSERYRARKERQRASRDGGGASN